MTQYPPRQYSRKVHAHVVYFSYSLDVLITVVHRLNLLVVYCSYRPVAKGQQQQQQRKATRSTRITPYTAVKSSHIARTLYCTARNCRKLFSPCARVPIIYCVHSASTKSAKVSEPAAMQSFVRICK